MRIEGSRVALIPSTTEEILSSLEWDEQDIDVVRYRQETEGSIWLSLHDGRRKQSFMILDPADRRIGVAELVDIRRGESVAELRICLSAKESRGHGLGSEALQLILTYAKDHLQLKKLYLRVYQSNRRAIACYRHAGFCKEARMMPGRRYPEPVLLMVRDLVPHEKRCRRFQPAG